MSGVPKASTFFWAHEGGRSGGKIVGVLVGEVGGENVAGKPMYEQHHVSTAVFGSAAGTAARTRRGSSSASSNGSHQNRLGVHTFRRGDVVKCLAAAEGEEIFTAA
eukprot:2772440-Pleurochrysis_carterae.AAC.1